MHIAVCKNADGKTMQLQGKRILVCPLDWGLGHATRCVPLIHDFIRQKAEVIVAADKRPLEFLKKEFPSLSFVVLPGYGITYPAHTSMAWHIARQLPKIYSGIRQEHAQLKTIIRTHQIDIVVSDNRYGLWNVDTETILITHQLMIKCPPSLKFFEPILHKYLLRFVKKFDHCWIPDYPGTNNLSGDLSHKYTLPANTTFIGPLSRFSKYKQKDAASTTHYDILVILSGPEPQRTIFEQIILAQLTHTTLKALIVQGKPELTGIQQPAPSVTLEPHLATQPLYDALMNSGLIICRSGYSTIMDLTATGKKAVLVPTPGQTEQEYLAGYFKQKKIFYSETQDVFNLLRAIQCSADYSGIASPPEPCPGTD